MQNIKITQIFIYGHVYKNNMFQFKTKSYIILDKKL